MWSHYNYRFNEYPYGNGIYPYPTYGQHPYHQYYQANLHPVQQSPLYRQQGVRGQATWTTGGQVTKCGVPWSDNEFMTVAVSENSPYKCGQSLKIRNLSTPGQREIIVSVVDTVAGYPANKINLHRKAFIALGANPNIGVMDIEIIASPELEEEKWGKYLLEVTQMAYPSYDVTDIIL